jgi:hypothetical protein
MAELLASQRDLQLRAAGAGHRGCLFDRLQHERRRGTRPEHGHGHLTRTVRYHRHPRPATAPPPCSTAYCTTSTSSPSTDPATGSKTTSLAQPPPPCHHPEAGHRHMRSYADNRFRRPRAPVCWSGASRRTPAVADERVRRLPRCQLPPVVPGRTAHLRQQSASAALAFRQPSSVTCFCSGPMRSRLAYSRFQWNRRRLPCRRPAGRGRSLFPRRRSR